VINNLRKFSIISKKKRVGREGLESRDGNGPDRRVKHQYRGSIRLLKSHTRSAQFIHLGLKISARPACGPSFSGPVRPGQTRSAVLFFLNRLRNIFF
jgi:hypothetical protein